MFLTIKKIPKKSWSSKNPFNLRPKLITIFFLVFGLTLFGAGEGLLIVSFTGASPWSVLAQGISLNTDISVGIVTFMVSLSVLSLWIFLKQKPGCIILSGNGILAPNEAIIYQPQGRIFCPKLACKISLEKPILMASVRNSDGDWVEILRHKNKFIAKLI